MSPILGFALALVAALVAIQLIAARTGLPAAALLTVGGLLYALAPGPNLEVPPSAVLTFLIPPLLFAAAINSSLIEIRHHVVPIASLSILLVLVTAVAVGIGFSLVVPGASVAVGVVVGAAVAPTDPIAALAVGRPAGLPSRLVTLIGGEGLLNDATALTTLAVVVTAVTTGAFSVATAAAEFLFATLGGLAVGVVVAFLVGASRHLVEDPILVNTISLATPFGIYLLATSLHTSGVLAVVVAGLLVGHQTSHTTTGTSRLQTRAVWRLVKFLLEGFVFLLIGDQLRVVIVGLHSYRTSTLVAAVGVTVVTSLLVRAGWLGLTLWLPAKLRSRMKDPSSRRAVSGREGAALTWAGTRGVITISIALALPLTRSNGADFPDRDLIVFCAYCVVLVTLIGQGTTFAPLLRRLHLPPDGDRAVLHARARAAAARAALSELEAIAERERVQPRDVDHLRASLVRRIDLDCEPNRGRSKTAWHSIRSRISAEEALHRAEHRLIELQRTELVRWRHLGRLPDASMRALHDELDHEEQSIRPLLAHPTRRPRT